VIPPEPQPDIDRTDRTDHASARILVVDDVPAIRYSIGKTLQRIGGQVSTASDAVEALKLIAEQPFDVVLTDIRLPDLNGVELLARIRVQSPDTVVILMTGYASLDTAIDAMRLGAYDYLVKPSDNQDIRRSVMRGLDHARELKRRSALLSAIQANVRELTNGKPPEVPRNSVLINSAPSIPASASTVTIGALTIYPGRYEIGVGERKIFMTPTEFDLLLYLVAHKGRVVPCQELVREVRGYTADESEAREVIRPHISNLRRKLAQTGQMHDMIVNVRGIGYRLTDTDDNTEFDEV